MSNDAEEYGYIAMYGDRRVEIRADSLYAAKLKALTLIRVPKNKRHLISVHLAERPDGTTVVHTPVD